LRAKREVVVFAAVTSWATASLACAPPVPVEATTTEARWRAAERELDALRATEPREPYGMVVRVTLREPVTGRVFDARGALAVDPHRALRMILIGPGGATALDAWVTEDAYRLEIPAIGRVRRGGIRPEPGLPVEFFRAWFLAPLAGRLLASFASAEGLRPEAAPCEGQWFVLRRDGATMTLCDEARTRGLSIVAVRRTPGSLERFAFDGQSLLPHAGDHAEYDDLRSGVRAKVDVESLDDAPPDAVAFVDPDRGGAR